MRKRRNIFLFGAGAVLDWTAPTTQKLTELVLQSGYKTVDDSTTITKYIYDRLIESGYEAREINFETIINLIDELISYHSNSDSQYRLTSSNKLPSLQSVIFDSKFEENIFNFEVEGGRTAHPFKLIIPKGYKPEYNYNHYSTGEETPKQMFLQMLLADLITYIINKVNSYAFDGHEAKEKLCISYHEMNSLFCGWIRATSDDAVIRIYTLNYDRIFKFILEEYNDSLEIFDGFISKEKLEYGESKRADILKILNDFDTHSHYNLHGCTHWETKAETINHIKTPRFYLTAHSQFPCNDLEHPIWQSEKGKSIMLTNIITGYQKIQKTIFPPFRQMQAAFDKDCCSADTIYIVGCSFGDEHINETLRTTIENNNKVDIKIIDPNFTKDHFDLNVLLKVFGVSQKNLQPINVAPNHYSFLNGQVSVHTLYFKDYLSKPVLYAMNKWLRYRTE